MRRRDIRNKFPNILVRGMGLIEGKLGVLLLSKINQLRLNSRVYFEEVTLEILVKRGEGTNNNPTKNIGKGYPTTLFTLLHYSDEKIWEQKR